MAIDLRRTVIEGPQDSGQKVLGRLLVSSWQCASTLAPVFRGEGRGEGILRPYSILCRRAVCMECRPHSRKALETWISRLKVRSGIGV
jgi:hypothetical protein